MNPSLLLAQATLAADLLKAMANESRLMILCSLLEGELSVGDLNTQVPLSQSALSQHLASLKRAGLVVARKQAQQVFYRLEGDAARQVLGLLQQLYCPKNESTTLGDSHDT